MGGDEDRRRQGEECDDEGYMAAMPATSVLAEDLRAPSRWPALDGVRGLAVVSVVLFHAVRLTVLRTDGGGSPLWWPASTARFALDAFFVLSGFLVVGSWTSLRRRHDRTWPAVREYAVRRAARILPAYWVSLVILIPLLAPHLLASPGKLGLFAAVQQYLVPGLPSEVNVVYWSLTTEVHFYVVAPLLAFALERWRSWAVIAALVVTAVVWRVWLPFGLPPSLVVGRLEQFALGAVAADLVRDHEAGRALSPLARGALSLVRRSGAGVVLAAALLALGVYQGAVLDHGAHSVVSHLLHPAVGFVMAGLFVRALTTASLSFLAHPLLRAAGLVSYGVYLFHFPVLDRGLSLFGLDPARGASSAVSVIAALAFLTVVAFALGTLSYVLIERPFLRLGRGDATPARPVIDLTVLERQDA
jgi:peptidoglycan/LPS O-acetylase OafA/YrhL